MSVAAGADLAYGTPPDAGVRLSPEQVEAAATEADAGQVEQLLLLAGVVGAYNEVWELANPATSYQRFVELLAEVMVIFGSAARSLAAQQIARQRAVAGLPALPDLEGRLLNLEDLRQDVPQAVVGIDELGYEVGRDVTARRIGLPAPDPETTRARGLGATIRRSLAPGRAAVVNLAEDRRERGTEAADPDIIGWYRITDGDPCAFCAMLASRGAVYTTARSAGVDLFVASAAQRAAEQGQGGPWPADSWHPSCACRAAPLYSTDTRLPDLNVEFRQLWDTTTRDLSGAEARRAFRRAMNERRARLAENSTNNAANNSGLA